jgi:hypothetical protein
MKIHAQAYHRCRITPMHVEKLLLQSDLTFQIHGCCDSIMLQPDGANVMVDFQDVENDR